MLFAARPSVNPGSHRCSCSIKAAESGTPRKAHSQSVA